MLTRWSNSIGISPNRALHTSEPLRNGSRIKSNASSHPERGYPSRRGLLEDRDRRNVEQRRNLLCGQGAPDLLDLICDRHSPVQSALLVFPPRSAWAEFVTVDRSPVTLERGRVHSDNWFAVAILAIIGQLRRTPIIVKNGRVVGAAALQARAGLENSLQVVWSWLGHDACSAFSRTLPKAPVVEFSTAIRARMRPPFRPVSFTSIPSSANSSTIWLKSSGLSHRSCCLSVTAYCLPHFLDIC